MPTASQPLSGPDGLPAQPWWRFWYALYKRTQATIPYIVSSSVAAAGGTQNSATVLTAEWNYVNSGSGGGVLLNAFGQGFASFVWNGSGGNINVYPPVGCTIDGAATNSPKLLANGKCQVFNQLSATYFATLQLG